MRGHCSRGHDPVLSIELNKISAAMTISVLIMRPSGEHSAPTDQTLGAKLCAGSDVLWEEQFFDREKPADLEQKFAPWRGRIKGVIGATRAAESQRLGEAADEMGILSFF